MNASNRRQRPNPLLELVEFGQSAWLDSLHRGMLVSGELQRLIDEDGLRGVTSNPTIFEEAIVQSHDYDDDLRALARGGKNEEEIYAALTTADIARAADIFRPTWDRLQGADGFVSLEVSPRLAHDTAETVAEARRLWAAVDRPNVFIKIPATEEGIPAIRQTLREGINVNVTLLFSLRRYRQVAEAYLTALEARAAAGEPLRVASVASFFLSRIDTMVDPLLEQVARAGGPQAEMAARTQGRVAIACAKSAYQIYQQWFTGARFQRLAERGARTQRLLWASTSTKNPAYSDVMYVDPLIGPDTINTLPLKTLAAYRDHGQPASRLEEGVEEAQKTLAELPRLGVDLEDIARQLEVQGEQRFTQSFDLLLKTIQARCANARPARRTTHDEAIEGS